MVTFFAGSFVANYLLIRPLLDAAPTPDDPDGPLKPIADKFRDSADKLKQSGVTNNPFNPKNKYGAGLLPYLIAQGVIKITGAKK